MPDQYADEKEKERDRSDSDADEEDACKQKAVQIKSSSGFQLAVACAIGLSTISMALETDYEEWQGWSVVNACFLIFFLFEISLRIVCERCQFVSCSNPDITWNMFDFSIVSLSILDFSVKAFTPAGGGQMMKYVLVLRTVRILRILRVLRLFRSFTQLSMLVAGLLESFRSVMWIGVMIFIVMLMFAIFITDQVHTFKFENFENKDDVKEYWGSVPRSLVTLFQFLTFDDWSMIASYITDEDDMAWMIVVFQLYVFVAAFAMLGLLTGVVTDHMNEVSQIQKKDLNADRDDDIVKCVQDYRKWLEEQHPHVQERNLQIRRQDFKALLRTDRRPGRDLKELGVSVHPADTDDIFDCLDKDADNILSWEEFEEGLKRMRGELQAKDMLRIRFAAERVAVLLGGGDEAATMQKLREVQDCMDDVDLRLKKLQKQLNGFIQERTTGFSGFRSIKLT